MNRREPREWYGRKNTALKTDEFVLIVHGSMEDTNYAKEILERNKPETLEQHQ